MNMKVVIIEGHLSSLMLSDDFKIEKDVFGPDIDIDRYGVLTPEEAGICLPDANAVISRTGVPFGREYINLLSNKCKLIVSIGVGFEQVDIVAAREKGIPVSNTPDYGIEEVADSAVAMIMSHARKITTFRDRSLRTKDCSWDWFIHRGQKRSNQTKVGIVGLGRTGTATALRLKAIGMDVLFYDPLLSRGVNKALGLKQFYDLKTMLAESDIVSIHTNDTSETRGIINSEFLARMKEDAVLVNVSRGTLFENSQVLHDVLRQRKNFRIATDVWPVEPPPKSDQLMAAYVDGEEWLGDRLLVTPHSAFYSEQSLYDIRFLTDQLIKHALDGGIPYNRVDG